MIKILTDTSALFSLEEGKRKNFQVLPLCINVKKQQFFDLELDPLQLMKWIDEGEVPSSSQPPFGEVLRAYEQEGEIIHLCMADGLSGTYQSACMAREQIEDKERIHVVNTKTLCGPHRYLVEKAVKLVQEGKSTAEILKELQTSIESVHSFLIPQDFEFLKRGGRLNATAAKVGSVLRLKPLMEAVEDGTRLAPYKLCRTMKKVIESMIEKYKELGIDASYQLYVAHADASKEAEMVKNALEEAFSDVSIEMLELSAAFITQGGPHCFAVQCIRK